MKENKFRFVVLLTTLLATGFVATSLVSYFVARDSLGRQLAESTLPLTSDNIYSEIQQDLLRPIFISSLMAQDTFLRDWSLAGEHAPEQLIRYLGEIKQRYDTVTSFFISESTRKYYHATGVLKTVREDDPGDAWYFRVRAMKEDYEINIDSDTANPSAMTVFINYRVYDYAGQHIGTAGVGLAVETVKKLVEVYQQRYGRRVFFVDREGQVTMHGSGYTGPSNIRQAPGIAKLTTKILASPSGSFVYRRDGTTVHLNSRLVPELKWYLIVEQDEDAVGREIFGTLIGNFIACLVITAVVLFLVNLLIRGHQRQLENLAATDALTGIFNRRAFESVLNTALNSAKRRQAPLSVLLLDIDHFKVTNDTHGHLAGDEILKTIAHAISGAIRGSDAVCRWGGEEFLMVLDDCDAAAAKALGEKIRAEIHNHPVAFDDKNIPVTASIGVAQYRIGEPPDSLIKRADAALYAAKNAGRDRVHACA